MDDIDRSELHRKTRKSQRNKIRQDDFVRSGYRWKIVSTSRTGLSEETESSVQKGISRVNISDCS